MRRREQRGLLFSLIFLTALAGPAWAQSDSLEIGLWARGTAELEDQTTIEIRPIEDRPEYRDLAPVIEQFLRAQNLQPASRGQLILRYEIQTDGAVNPREPLVSLQGRTGIGGSTDMQMTLKLRQKSRSHARRRIVMSFELYRPGSPPLWTARLEGPDDRRSRSILLEEMAIIAIENIGKTNTVTINSNK